MSKQRVILIGIDGATWDLIDQFINQGLLPNFAKLKQKGSWGVLKSTVPCYSPLAWNSIFSGVNPAKHTILGFVDHAYGSLALRPISSLDRQYPALWNYANHYSLDSVFINIPFSFPLNQVRGTFISGLGTPSKDNAYTYPREFKTYLKKNYPDYRIDFNEELMTKKSNSQLFKKMSFKIFNSRLKLAQDLFKQGDFQIFSLVIRLTDILQHFCWQDTATLREAYQGLDDFLGFLFNKMQDNDKLVIISDHGFTKLKKMVHLVNFLIEEGFMVLKKKAKFKKTFNTTQIKQTILNLGGERLLNLLKQNKLLRNFLFRTLPPDKYSYLKKIDWQKSLLSYAEGSGGVINFNPEIKKDSSKAREVFLRLKEKALALTDCGQKVFRCVF